MQWCKSHLFYVSIFLFLYNFSKHVFYPSLRCEWEWQSPRVMAYDVFSCSVQKRITRTGRVLTILFVSLFVLPKSPTAFFLISNKEWILKISCQCNFLFGKHVRFPKKTRLAIIISDHGIIYLNFLSFRKRQSNRVGSNCRHFPVT